MLNNSLDPIIFPLRRRPVPSYGEVGGPLPPPLPMLNAGFLPMPRRAAGVVPVSYVLTGATANVVPVQTVQNFEAGVVLVTDQSDQKNNVVLVRETSTEVPRVKVMKAY